MNNLIKLWLLNFLILIGSLANPIMAQSFNGNNNNFQMPELTEEDIAEFEKQIQEELSKLPQEEQDKILKEAEILAEKMKVAIDEIGGEEALKNMSEEEALKFFEKIFEEEATPSEPIKPEPAKEEKKPAEEEKTLSNKQQKALDLINNLIRVCNSFLIKSAGVPEFPEKIKSWVKKKKIKYWEGDTKWETIKNNLELLVQKLEKVKEQDAKTKQYKFLDDFVADETLYNNLSKLLNDFKTYEPSIDPTVFGLKKLEKDSKTAIQKFASSFGEAIQQLKVLTALDKIFEKYEPKAKKMKEEEIAAQKKAETESRKPLTPGKQVIGGKPETPPLIGGRTQYGPATYPTGYEPSYIPSSRPSEGSRPSTIDDKKQPTKPGTKSTSAKPQEEKDKIDEKALPKAEKPTPEDRRIVRALDQIESSFDAAISYLEEDQTKETLDNLEAYIRNDKQEISGTLSSQASRIINKLTGPGDSVLTGINRLKQQLKSAPKERKVKYKKELETIITKDQEKTFKTIADNIEKIQKKRRSFTTKEAKEKLERHFGDATDKDAQEKAPLNRLASAIQELFKAIQEF